MTRTLAGMFAVLFICAPGGLWAAEAAKASDRKQLPEFAIIEQAIGQHFASLADYKPGFLLSQKQVEPLFERLAALGWTVADRQAITALVPADDEFLVQQLRSESGRKLMNRLRQNPEGYDRLDRLAQLPRGRQTVRDIVKGPDGYKLLTYMTDTRGGDALGDMLARTPRGANFNQPTGRIYTAEQLTSSLRASHARAAKAQQSAAASK